MLPTFFLLFSPSFPVLSSHALTLCFHCPNIFAKYRNVLRLTAVRLPKFGGWAQAPDTWCMHLLYVPGIELLILFADVTVKHNRLSMVCVWNFQSQATYRRYSWLGQNRFRCDDAYNVTTDNIVQFICMISMCVVELSFRLLVWSCSFMSLYTQVACVASLLTITNHLVMLHLLNK